MSSTATLNIRLSEELKERGMQVLARENISVSEAVRQLFCELERSQQLPDFLLGGGGEGVVEEKRRLLRTMTGQVRPVPDSLEPPIAALGHDWRQDWHEHILAKYGSESV